MCLMCMRYRGWRLLMSGFWVIKLGIRILWFLSKLKIQLVIAVLGC